MFASQARGVRSCVRCGIVARPVRAKAVDGMYNHIVPNFDYINAVIDAFPDDAVANPDEARVRSTFNLHCLRHASVQMRCPWPRGALPPPAWLAAPRALEFPPFHTPQTREFVYPILE